MERQRASCQRIFYPDFSIISKIVRQWYFGRLGEQWRLFKMKAIGSRRGSLTVT
jgi:hypothetical protein